MTKEEKGNDLELKELVVHLITVKSQLCQGLHIPENDVVTTPGGHGVGIWSDLILLLHVI